MNTILWILIPIVVYGLIVWQSAYWHSVGGYFLEWKPGFKWIGYFCAFLGLLALPALTLLQNHHSKLYTYLMRRR